MGVRGIRLKEGDWLVAAGVSSQGSSLLTITEQGYGKRTLLEEYSPQTRGGFGSKNYRITEKTGPVACAAVVQDKDDALMISDDGTITVPPGQRHQPVRPCAPGRAYYDPSAEGRQGHFSGYHLRRGGRRFL